jgi:hypothetical protein
MSGTSKPVTQHHISETSNPLHHHHHVNLKILDYWAIISFDYIMNSAAIWHDDQYAFV